MTNPTGKGGFTKADPRINRKGRPKNFDGLRRLSQQIACEIAESADKSIAMSRIEIILRDWSSSKDPRKQAAFIEYAYGKVPSPVALQGDEDKPITVKVIHVARNRIDDSGIASGPTAGPQ